MSNGQNPLVLMMALSLPGAAHALGLGDIHVDSKLNEPLAAQIDIVGASAEELAALSAAVANRETFVRYGADRPAFLTSTTFKVTHDSLGHPVLAVRSGESFTEPVVNFLVDLRWHKGELVREYTLLLDPAVFAPASRAADTASAPVVQSVPAAATAAAVQAAPVTQATSAAQAAPAIQAAPVAQATAATQVAPVIQAPRIVQAALVVATSTIEAAKATRARDPQAKNQQPSSAKPAARKMTHYKVGAKGTLRGIAWRVGARSESDLQRLMIAIFRANPAAFEGNINRLRRGALLGIPGTADVSAISAAEAKREIRMQMAAWHSPGKTTAAGAAAPAVALPDARPAPIVADEPVVKTSEAADPQALNRRVQSLEQELHEMQRLLESEHAKVLGVQLQVGRAEKSAPAVTRSPRDSGSTLFGSVVAGLGMLVGAFAALYFWVRRRSSQLIDSRSARPAAEEVPPLAGADSSAEERAQGNMPGAVQIDAQDSAPAIAEPNDDDATMPLPVIRGDDEPMHRAIAATEARSAGADDPTVTLPANAVNPPVDTVGLRVDTENLDFNLVDLDMTAQHVQMPSVLHEHVVVKERRTNVVDVLRAALAREPDRHDLRLKLLELYYAAAATNRQGFLEVVQRLARERDYLSEGEWDKIAYMGRQIAAENPLFTEAADDDELADCA